VVRCLLKAVITVRVPFKEDSMSSTLARSALVVLVLLGLHFTVQYSHAANSTNNFISVEAETFSNPEKVVKSCLIRVNNTPASCSMSIDGVTIRVSFNLGTHPVTFRFSNPRWTAFSLALNSSYSRDGYTFSNYMKSNGDIVASVSRR
jgi:hypothetical protein